MVVGGLALAWTILATAILMFDSISAGTSRDQVARQQALYEQRLTALSEDRDARSGRRDPDIYRSGQRKVHAGKRNHAYTVDARAQSAETETADQGAHSL